ncbi:transglycosylase SLT domain-containing protein [Sulfitobacter sp. TSTF-M16]|uniref:Transglycosylase SLT domain-containing protein n=2 Tax=Sulfitobacter aestuariivivens TaxID=2766981 RepID=A0A927HHR2_9RHOB|nr:transglycosylase SLT domain-containing protein [Sulfitobacter aestuariivivens]MBD3665515.1 transglycosylase SLT domain-containing protein [Sulfitobacter aestuariivivens]
MPLPRITETSYRVYLCCALCWASSSAVWVSLAHSATPDPVHVCDLAAKRAAQQTGVPLNVLRAITRTETGRRTSLQLQPWPWTVNMEGNGVWFDTESEAHVYVFRHFKRGARSFDVGCFQLNYKWHGQAFDSIEQMFDPVKNAVYAAGFLKRLHAELGDWNKAAGAYHSRTHKYAARYMKRYAANYANLQEPEQVSPLDGPYRANRFPLLRARDGGAAAGSLVPLDTAAGVPFFSPRDGG